MINGRIVLIGRPTMYVSKRNIIANDGTQYRIEAARNGKSAEIISLTTDEPVYSVEASSIAQLKRGLRNALIELGCRFSGDNKIRPTSASVELIPTGPNLVVTLSTYVPTIPTNTVYSVIATLSEPLVDNITINVSNTYETISIVILAGLTSSDNAFTEISVVENTLVTHSITSTVGGTYASIDTTDQTDITILA